MKALRRAMSLSAARAEWNLALLATEQGLSGPKRAFEDAARILFDAVRRAEVGVFTKASIDFFCRRWRSNRILARASCMPVLKRC
jgi:hypothetical protein